MLRLWEWRKACWLAYWAAAEWIAGHTFDRLQAHGLNVEAEVREGRPSEMNLSRAAELGGYLLVSGAQGLRDPEEFQRGFTAHKPADYVECSVLVVR